ncbi:MAG: hypothetical protein K6A82_01010 [Prevotella sp.]|nr:hypothetical protein [Prevotella sp.]
MDRARAPFLVFPRSFCAGEAPYTFLCGSNSTISIDTFLPLTRVASYLTASITLARSQSHAEQEKAPR